MASVACSLQGTLVNPGAIGVTGTLYITYNRAGSVDNGNGTFVGVVPGVPVVIAVRNGVVTPTNVVANSSTTNPTTCNAELRDTQGNIVFSETWSIIPSYGIFDVGTIIPIASAQLPAVVNVSSQISKGTPGAPGQGISYDSRSLLIISDGVDDLEVLARRGQALAIPNVVEPDTRGIYLSDGVNEIPFIVVSGGQLAIPAHIKLLGAAAGGTSGGTTGPVSLDQIGLAVSALNATCVAFSAEVRNRFNTTMATPIWNYNLMVQYGQSLSNGYETTCAYTTTQEYGNVMLGTELNWLGRTTAQLNGDNNFHPAIENSYTAAAASGTLGQPGYSPATGTGEVGIVALCNAVKAYMNTLERVVDNPNKLFACTSAGFGGVSVQFLSKNAQPLYYPQPGDNLWQRIIYSMQYTKANATALGNKTSGVTGLFYAQGEANSGDAEAFYSPLLAQLRADFDAQAFTTFGQTKQAGMYTYQTAGVLDSTNMGVNMAQWDLAKTQPNWFLYGPHYAYPDMGVHKTGNSYRWMEQMAAKVYFRTAVLRQGWLPLGPHKIQWVGNTLLVGFHVPEGVLQAQTGYYGHTTYLYADLGFSLFDSSGYIPCTVAIVADQVVSFIPSRTVDQSTAFLRYADAGNQYNGSPAHNNRGNLCDTDSWTAYYNYISPDLDTIRTGNNYDFPSLINKPYNLNNWCVAFHIQLATFAG